MKVLVIGAGNMGLTYAKAMSKSKLLKKKDLLIADNSLEKVNSLKKDGAFDVYLDAKDCVAIADIIFIAVKPYHADSLFTSIKGLLKKDHVIVSIMAGVTLDKIKEATGISKVVRAMPNLPAQVGKGVTSFMPADDVSSLELHTIRNLLDTTGKSLRVKNEDYIDKSTGISGSGPAYVFYFIQSMMEAATKMGFSEKEAKVMVSLTFEGAIEMYNSSELSADSWMNRVASKGGTTRAALNSMEDNRVKDLIKEAAMAAFERAVEIGQE